MVVVVVVIIIISIKVAIDALLSVIKFSHSYL